MQHLSFWKVTLFKLKGIFIHEFFTLEGQVKFINKVVPYFVMGMVMIMFYLAGFTASHSVLFFLVLLSMAIGIGLSYIWLRVNLVKKLELPVRNGTNGIKIERMANL